MKACHMRKFMCKDYVSFEATARNTSKTKRSLHKKRQTAKWNGKIVCSPHKACSKLEI